MRIPVPTTWTRPNPDKPERLHASYLQHLIEHGLMRIWMKGEFALEWCPVQIEGAPLPAPSTLVLVERTLLEGLRGFMNRRFDKDRLANHQLLFIQEIDRALARAEVGDQIKHWDTPLPNDVKIEVGDSVAQKEK